MLKDGAENFVGGDGAAGDFGEVEDAGAEILCNEIAGKMKGEGRKNALNVVEGSGEGGKMTNVADDDVTAGGGLLVGR